MSSEESRSLRERLADEIGVCLASDLVAHLKRGALVVVHADLELLDVAVAVAEDNVVRVRSWIESKQMQNPTPSQIERLVSAPDDKFRSVIVRPYVLIQPLPHAQD